MHSTKYQRISLQYWSLTRTQLNCDKTANKPDSVQNKNTVSAKDRDNFAIIA